MAGLPAPLRLVEPRLRRLTDRVHAHGVRVFHHDDGAIRPLIGDLIGAGIDLLADHATANVLALYDAVREAGARG